MPEWEECPCGFEQPSNKDSVPLTSPEDYSSRWHLLNQTLKPCRDFSNNLWPTWCILFAYGAFY